MDAPAPPSDCTCRSWHVWFISHNRSHTNAVSPVPYFACPPNDHETALCSVLLVLPQMRAKKAKEEQLRTAAEESLAEMVDDQLQEQQAVVDHLTRAEAEYAAELARGMDAVITSPAPPPPAAGAAHAAAHRTASPAAANASSKARATVQSTPAKSSQTARAQQQPTVSKEEAELDDLLDSFLASHKSSGGSSLHSQQTGKQSSSSSSRQQGTWTQQGNGAAAADQELTDETEVDEDLLLEMMDAVE